MAKDHFLIEAYQQILEFRKPQRKNGGEENQPNMHLVYLKHPDGEYREHLEHPTFKKAKDMADHYNEFGVEAHAFTVSHAEWNSHKHADSLVRARLNQQK